MVTISVGQALLILINKRKNADGSYDRDLLRLYLSGVKNASDKMILQSLLTDEALSEYIISADPKVINTDPTRRYFETHLAYHTLTQLLSNISLEDLQAHHDGLEKISSKIPNINENIKYKNVLERINDRTYQQADQFNASQPNKNPIVKPSLSEEDYKKLALMEQITYIGGQNVKVNPLRFTIMLVRQFVMGIFSRKNKDRKSKENNQHIASANLGIMTSVMPLPRNDLAYTEIPFDTTRATDQAEYNPKAKWVNENFNTQTHPFVNGISGTTLAQLRNLSYLANRGKLAFYSKEKFYPFVACFAANMLFSSGAHSFHEIFSVFKLPEIQSAFKTLGIVSGLDEETILLNGNEIAFNQSIVEAIEYNNAILAKQKLNESIQKRPADFLAKKQNIQSKTKAVQQRLDEKNNYYILSVLSKYIEIKNKEISRVCKHYNVSDLDQLKIKAEFLTSLKRINFMEAYVKNQIKKIKTDDLTIDYVDFEKFITKKMPLINEPKKYIEKILDPSNGKETLLNKMYDITKTINSTSSSAKKKLIKSFNARMSTLIKITEKTICGPEAVQEIEQEIKSILADLQEKEDKYYQKLFFFNDLRKQSSSLQPLLNEAVKIAKATPKVRFR